MDIHIFTYSTDNSTHGNKSAWWPRYHQRCHRICCAAFLFCFIHFRDLHCIHSHSLILFFSPGRIAMKTKKMKRENTFQRHPMIVNDIHMGEEEETAIVRKKKKVEIYTCSCIHQ